MVDQIADGSDGSDANRAKADEKWNAPCNTQGGKHQDGGNGTYVSMESMAKDQADQEGQKEMNPAMQFKRASIKLFNDKADIKYDKGQAEHGGYLPWDVTFKDLEDEIIDMWFYVQGMKCKVAKFAGNPGRRMFFQKEKTSTIEGMIREATQNKLD